MNTYIAYFDETGDDGSNTMSSSQFVLSSLYMDANVWQSNYDKVRECRKDLKIFMDFIFRRKYIQSILLEIKVCIALTIGPMIKEEIY